MTLLYALHLLDQPIQPGLSIRAILAHSAIGQTVQEYLYDAVEDLLDAGGSSSSIALGEGDEYEVEKMMWRRWLVEERTEAHVSCE